MRREVALMSMAMVLSTLSTPGASPTASAQSQAPASGYNATDEFNAFVKNQPEMSSSQPSTAQVESGRSCSTPVQDGFAIGCQSHNKG